VRVDVLGGDPSADEGDGQCGQCAAKPPLEGSGGDTYGFRALALAGCTTAVAVALGVGTTARAGATRTDIDGDSPPVHHAAHDLGAHATSLARE